MADILRSFVTKIKLTNIKWLVMGRWPARAFTPIIQVICQTRPLILEKFSFWPTVEYKEVFLLNFR
jgi:hypothetical protein